MTISISFACSNCQARLRASSAFVGRSCPCPRCGLPVRVPPQAPAEEDPVLVSDDTEGHWPGPRPQGLDPRIP
jgi:DNA-directed RNA polymerase subunit RPC12/RpoP